jgi:hypothetical protein
LAAPNIARGPNPPYPPDLNPCDFRPFGFLKKSMKNIEFSTENHVVDAITTTWRDFSFEILQSLFKEWMRRRICLIDSNGQCEFESKIVTRNQT